MLANQFAPLPKLLPANPGPLLNSPPKKTHLVTYKKQCSDYPLTQVLTK